MLDFFTAFTNTDGVVFPGTASVNASGAGATDGTEFVKIMIDHIWGSSQALLNYAGMTPNSIQEADGASQLLDAGFRAYGAGPGFVSEWNGNADPSTFGIRALPLNGQGILRANYVELDANVYVGDGNNAAVAAGGGAYYRADDAAGTIPNIAGVYLILPERRGYVPRGLDLAATVDPLGAARFLGDSQLDAFQGHKHDASAGNLYNASGPGTIQGGLTLSGAAATLGTIMDAAPITDGTNGTPRTSSESRMVNVSTQFVITY